jgi:lysophospholipase L1-like esterase
VDKTYTPDVIVINHGTNDRGQDDEVFAEKLEETLEHLRGTYPDAPIVYLIPFSQDHAQTIENTVEGIENSYVISTKDWVLTYTDGVHLDVAGARVAGELLAVELKNIFGEEFFDNSRQA